MRPGVSHGTRRSIPRPETVRYRQDMRLLHASLIAASALTLSAVSSAHIRLDSPPPRYLDGESGQKTAHCGGGTMPSGVVTEWMVGEEVTISWTETINHSGHYRIAIDPTGTDNFKNPDPVGSKTVVGNTIGFIDDTSAVTNNVVDFTFIVPDYPCESCTLQLLQYMAGAASPFYYFCADVKIVSNSGSTTTATTGSGSGAGVGGGGQGGEGAGGEDETSSTSAGTPQYPNFARESTGCSVGGPTSRFSGLGGLTLLAAAALLRRRRD
jgi:MYXO-CTERM domain-containing protein